MVSFDHSLHDDEDVHDTLAAYALTHGSPIGTS